MYKAALQDRSRTVWRGMIKVDKDAQRTNAYQRNDNLMLSRDARADSIPGLEIEADDVRCTHGSTSGRVDDQQVFYAMTRGYTRREAVRMIVAGFFQQVFDRITIESVRDALGEAIGRRVSDIKELAGVTRVEVLANVVRFVGLLVTLSGCGTRPAECAWSSRAELMNGGDRPSSLKMGIAVIDRRACCCCSVERGWQIGHDCNELILFLLRRRPKFPTPASCWSRWASGWWC